MVIEKKPGDRCLGKNSRNGEQILGLHFMVYVPKQDLGAQVVGGGDST